MPPVRSTPSTKTRTKSAVQDDIHARQVAWLDWLKQRTGKSLAALARAASRSPNLLTRKFAEGGHLSAATIELLMESTGLPGPDMYLLQGARGLAEEAEPYNPGESGTDAVTKQMLDLALKGRPNAAPWRLKSRALEDEGYRPGDILISDAAIVPNVRDVVVAQVYDLRTGTAETIFRILEPPYLIAASADPELRKPLLVDDERVIVMGTVTQSFRSRRPN